ncbi:PLC-like phosphodiesterases superfamily protein [Striga asiatica]|uniref:PLC-like phosphodiesterases superfamily protein n=1 Tax=Striga asiatica TaxID=4170 RepID=A0A5A7QVQ2_STRAF|nr:PLC-like phosphodiesterases superfamily protein [Striga asiatica]
MGLGKVLTSVFAVLLVSRLLEAACSNGACKVGDECSTDSDCGRGLYCFSCKTDFDGNRCVRSTATNQFTLLNNSLPFNKYAFLTTHNAFAIDDGQPRLTFTNQEDTISQQLNNGVRGLMLDTYDYEGDIWLCHSYGGKCHDYTKFKPAINTFREIEAFLSRNPSEIVTLILEDYVETPYGLTKVFKDSGLMKYWFPLSRMPKGGHDWPLANDMVAKNQRLLVFTSKESKETSEGIAYQWNYMNSGNLDDMLETCYAAAGNRWANFVAVDFYKRSEGGGTFKATDMLNGELFQSQAVPLNHDHPFEDRRGKKNGLKFF